ncbi:MAG: pyridoxal phosphate-dependent aminotransferase [Bacteroidota bacterium]
MPNISQRVAQAYSSPIRKLTPFADQAKANGKTVFHLNIGQPDLETPSVAFEKIRQTNIQVLKYGPSKGVLSYRQKLVQYYERFNIQVTAEDILVTTGASEAILFLALSCMDKGDEVIIPEPFYANYIGFAEIADVHIKPVTSTIENNFELPSAEDFEKLITPKTKAILICNPNNPTGCLYSKEALEALGRVVKKHNLFLFVDEVYREFCYDGLAFFSVLNLAGLEKNVAVVDSISKRYSACGARIGAIISRNQDLVNAITKLGQFRLCAPVLGQMIAEAILENDGNYLAEAQRAYARRRALLYDRLRKMEGVTCYQPGGAFYIFAKLPIDDGDRFCQWLLENFSHNNQTLMLSPGAGFYATEGLGKQEVRIAYVLNVDDLNKAMDCLELALKEYQCLRRDFREEKGKMQEEGGGNRNSI